jgi:hypothetical protein
MRIKKFSVAVFIVSFIIGCGAVLIFVKPKRISVYEMKVLPKIETSTTVKPQPIEKEISFAPEIFGLKDFPDEFVLPKYKIKLVDVAEHGNIYRKEEVIAKNGEKWLGFFSGNNGTYLKSAKVKVTQDKDVSEIKFASSKSEPLFLIRNAKNLKEGKVLTLFQENSSDDVDFQDRTNVMYPGFVREFQLGEKKYTLQIKDALTKSGEKMSALVLESEGVSQVIYYNYYFDGEYLGSLLWAGDLDGDGKLDLYMNHNDYEKGAFSSSLFLSSEAAKGKLVKEAAHFFTAGC